MAKSIAEINEKIKKGQVVVVTKEEVLDIVKDKGLKKTSEYVDVVTTGTFGPMCSSTAIFNIGHAKPKIKIQKAWVNDVPCYCGLAAVDLIIGATELRENDPVNLYYPGEFKYGGAHVIEEMVRGNDLKLRAVAYGTDCYPRKELNTLINLKDLNDAWLLNPRNAYQNYNVAVNISQKTIYTYMGMLRENLGNANYCSAGQLSPLLNDPYFKTIGIGTRIFLGGGIGYIFGHGTQHATKVKRTKEGVPITPAGTLAVQGDLKKMNGEWLRAASIQGYGVSLAVGIGVPIPIVDEKIMKDVCVRDEDLLAQVIDYSGAYPQGKSDCLGYVTYKDLRSGSIVVNDRKIPATGMSSYFKAREICEILKAWIKKGDFLLSEPVASMPGENSEMIFKPLNYRESRS